MADVVIPRITQTLRRHQAELDAANGQAAKLAGDLAATQAVVRMRESALRACGVDVPESAAAAAARDTLAAEITTLRRALRRIRDEEFATAAEYAATGHDLAQRDSMVIADAALLETGQRVAPEPTVGAGGRRAGA